MYTKCLIFTNTNMITYNEFVLDSVVFLNFCSVIFWFGQPLYFFGYIEILAVIALDGDGMLFSVEALFPSFSCVVFGLGSTCFRSIKILTVCFWCLTVCCFRWKRWKKFARAQPEVLNVQKHVYIDYAQMMRGCVRFWFSSSSSTSGVGFLGMVLF